MHHGQNPLGSVTHEKRERDQAFTYSANHPGERVIEFAENRRMMFPSLGQIFPNRDSPTLTYRCKPRKLHEWYD